MDRPLRPAIAGRVEGTAIVPISLGFVHLELRTPVIVRADSRARIAFAWLGTVTIPADSGTFGDDRQKNLT